MHTEDITAGFKTWRYPILVLFLLAFPSVSLAANHYVWCGASGGTTGANFTNAYRDLPVSLTRGDTYYVAGSSSCTYRAHTFNDTLSGTSVISILHATASANSGVAGWQAAFGTIPAKWATTQAYGGGCNVSLWVIKKSYYTFDGEFGTVGTIEPTSGTFGFYLKNSVDCRNFVYLDGTDATLSNLTFNRLEMDGSPMNINNLVAGGAAFQVVCTSGSICATGMSVYENYLHDVGTNFFHFHSVSNSTFDHSWMARIMYNYGAHSNGVSLNPGVPGELASNLTFSNDTWQDACGTSVITAMNGAVNNLVIYGNTFFQTTNTIIFPGGTTPVDCNGGGQIGDLGTRQDSAVTTGATIVNNTFYNGSLGLNGIYFSNTAATNIIQTNNLFVNSANIYLTLSCTGCSEDHNTVINKYLGFSTPCNGTGDSCQGTSVAITSSSVASNLADVHIASGHGLSVGSPVLVMGAQAGSTTPCGIDTYYPYPTVSQVVSSTEFKYTVQQRVPNATCQEGYGVLIPSPVAIPFASTASKNFTLRSEAIDRHLNDGISLPPPYNIDSNGNVRGRYGNWDRGAYQFLGSSLLDPPTNLKAVTK
jgi:hypothetical protein